MLGVQTVVLRAGAMDELVRGPAGEVGASEVHPYCEETVPISEGGSQRC